MDADIQVFCGIIKAWMMIIQCEPQMHKLT